MHRIASAVLLTIISLAVTQPTPASAAGVPALDAEERAFCQKINQHRAQKGLPALRVSASLTKAARWKSTDMATKSSFGHIDSRGRDFTSRMKAFRYGFSTARAENIAAGSTNAAAAFEQWRRSPGHNTNMLSRAFKVIGIGRAYRAGSTYGGYWTTNFGGRADRTIAC